MPKTRLTFDCRSRLASQLACGPDCMQYTTMSGTRFRALLHEPRARCGSQRDPRIPQRDPTAQLTVRAYEFSVLARLGGYPRGRPPRRPADRDADQHRGQDPLARRAGGHWRRPDRGDGLRVSAGRARHGRRRAGGRLRRRRSPGRNGRRWWPARTGRVAPPPPACG